MSKKYFDIHKPVFWPAVILIVIFIAITLYVGEPMETIFANVQDMISTNFGWVFITAINLFIVFCFYIGFSKFGSIRLGGKDAKPEFSTIAWFSMLFSAGMGIGLLFWGVAEPIQHYSNAPKGESYTVEAAESAMNLTFLHWGFHAWAIYALVALALAFFAYNRKKPLTIRSVFYPLLGDKIYGWIGDAIDVLAVLATLFGLATSLGLGVQQIGGGISYLTDITNNEYLQVGLIGGITLIATISVVSGIDKGVKFLSEWNVRIAGILLLFVILAGPTLFIFQSLIQNIGNYMNDVLAVATWTEAYEGTNWQGGWTVFYWAWWVSWSPFVGMFIARVSRGRTIRQFVFGVLLVPTLLTFLWLSTFGGSAIWLDLQAGDNVLANAINQDNATALFVFLQEFPVSIVGVVVAVLLVMSFFVTSSDSGSLVIDSITAGGKLDAPVGQRVFWALSEGTVAAVLLWWGGLTALQTAAIITGLPFLAVLLIMCYSLLKGLRLEYAREKELDKQKDREGYEKRLAEVITKNIEKNRKS